MPRRKPQPRDIVNAEFASLRKLVNNLLLNNVNFENGHIDKTYPRSWEFIRGPLREQAQFILERLEQAQSLCADMAADSAE